MGCRQSLGGVDTVFGSGYGHATGGRWGRALPELGGVGGGDASGITVGTIILVVAGGGGGAARNGLGVSGGDAGASGGRAVAGLAS